MKRLIAAAAALFLLLSAVSVYAGDAQKASGEVLYHQDFADIDSFASSGIRIGTSSSEASVISCAGDALEIRTLDKGRIHLILPDFERGESDTFTIEFSFRFTDIHSSNGYLAPILTCRGCDPGNITSVPIRADGSVDDFKLTDDAYAEALRSAETVYVKIPVISGAVNTVFFEIDGKTFSAERRELLVISDGSVGFTVRNCNVEIDEVYIVNGVGYEEKNGYYSENSYANENAPALTPDCPEAEGEIAPPTGDNSYIPAVVALTAGIGLVVLGVLGRRRR